MEKYERPENCKDLKAVKVNKEIWIQLNLKHRKMQLQLANMQQLTRKIIFPNFQTTNWFLSQTSSTDSKQLLTELVDAIAMLGYVNTQVSLFLKEQIWPALKPVYKAICSAEKLVDSQHLFADDLAKQLNDACEAGKISHNTIHTTTHKIAKGNYRHQRLRESHYGKGQKKDFYGKAITHPSSVANHSHKARRPKTNPNRMRYISN